VVIAPEPLVRYTPLQFGPKSDAVITQYDMKAVGDIGLLKIDFLGLQNLDIIATCLRLLREHRGVEIDIDKIPFDDAKTYALLSSGDTHGVFQLEGAGMRRMVMDMRPQTFSDVSAAVALFRPGPMVNIPAFIARKQGREPIEYMHERLEPILRETYGVMIYQEQVMMAARELAGFTMSEADILRAAMGKKDKVKMAKQRTKFVAGAVEREIPPATAEALFDGIAKFAEYGFNRAHSAAYGLIAYQTAYLKANYTLEYMTSLLIHMEGSADRVATAIVDCRLRGIEVLAPDINRSRADFSMSDGRIQFGLAAIKNVGQHAVENIVAMREADGAFKSLEDLCERTGAIQDVNRRVLEALVQSGACDSLGEGPALNVLNTSSPGGLEAAQDEAGRPTCTTHRFGRGRRDQLRPWHRVAYAGRSCSSKELPALPGRYPLRRISKAAERSDTQAVEVTSALPDTEYGWRAWCRRCGAW
jgi:DNA polymerase-3 subunit alpha